LIGRIVGGWSGFCLDDRDVSGIGNVDYYRVTTVIAVDVETPSANALGVQEGAFMASGAVIWCSGMIRDFSGG
jgi:hypothetical protein